MRIFAVGDFHGTVPKKFKKIAQSCDLVLCTGDFPKTDALRKVNFKYWDELHEGHEMWDFTTKRSFIKMVNDEMKSSARVIKEIDSWEVPVATIDGNSDLTKDRLKGMFKAMKRKIPKTMPRFERTIRKSKNVTFFPNSVVDFDDKYQLITFYEHYMPDEFDKMVLKELFDQRIRRKKIIFLTHRPPRGLKIDKAEYGPYKGKHIGSKAIKWAIKKYKPAIHICGHIHESQGISRIGKTPSVNVGYGRKGQAAIIELNKKIKIKLIK